MSEGIQEVRVVNQNRMVLAISGLDIGIGIGIGYLAIRGLDGVVDDIIWLLEYTLPSVTRLITKLINTIVIAAVDGLPEILDTIVEGVGTLLPALMDSVITIMPKLIDTAGNLVTKYITEYVPKFYDSLGKFFLGLWDKIIGNEPIEYDPGEGEENPSDKPENPNQKPANDYIDEENAKRTGYYDYYMHSNKALETYSNIQAEEIHNLVK